jgi:vanillate O-demethylase monooxygenase subunit
MGVPELADPARIIDVPHFDDPDWAINCGPPMDVSCNYQYMNDNLLDPTHVSYVHASSLGNDDTIGIPVETEVLEDRVIVRRWILDHKLAPFFAHRVKFGGNADRLQHYELRLPSSAVIKDVIAPAGTGAPDGRLTADAWLVDSYNFVTPVDDGSCRYFWFQLRNYDVGDFAETEALTADFISAFKEDLVVLAAVQQGMKASERHIDLASDRGGNQARLMLKKWIRSEANSG